MKNSEYLQKVKQFIPSGSQTFSKNPEQYVLGVSPVAISKAKGAYVWDVEDRKFLDTVMALGPMILGYADERIDRVVKEQIDKGTIFSLPSDLEVQLAEKLSKVIPCAEMSRFLLNGGDATTGAVRLARYVTKKDHIAKCGYHGWQDWSIANKEGRNGGVPEDVKKLTHDFKYNDLDSLEEILNNFEVAAVIMEPANDVAPQEGYLEKVKKLANEKGAILIFDEMITGFRWSLGGAQEYFGVTPDLACFGKAISNGYPLSAICGKREIMEKMSEVFVSGTFGGDNLGLIAALETIRIMEEDQEFHERLHAKGEKLINDSNKVFQKYSLPLEFVGFGPHPTLKIKISDDLESRILKTYLYQEFNKRAILFITAIMISDAHTIENIDEIVRTFEELGAGLQGISDFKELEDRLEGEIIKPRGVRFS